ncbi:PqqD family protein [Bradyrhizobium betae]
MALTTSVPLLISQQFDSEVVLANYQNGVYYNLDGSAAQIWLGLKVNRTVEEIAGAIAAATGGDVPTITQQVQAFVDSMLAEGLIAEGPPRRAARPPWRPGRRCWRAHSSPRNSSASTICGSCC